VRVRILGRGDRFNGDTLSKSAFNRQDEIGTRSPLAKFTYALGAHQNKLARFKVEDSSNMVVGLFGLQ
jgi:hypothetical protein